MVKHLRTDAKEVTNNERLNDLVHQKIVQGKTKFPKTDAPRKVVLLEMPL